MNARPASLLAAVVLAALTGVAALLFAAMLFAVAASAVAFTLGAIVAVSSSGPQVPTLVGAGLVVAGLVAVIAPDTRRTLVQ